MHPTSVAITGISIASALGRDPEALADAIESGRTAVTHEHRYAPWIQAPLGTLPLAEWGIPEAERLQSDQIMRRVLQSMLRTLAERTGVFERYAPEEIGLFLGTTSCGIDGFFAAIQEGRATREPLLNFLSPDMQQVRIAHDMRAAFPIRGPHYTFSSSCAAAAQAIGQAYDAVRSGLCRVAIAGGIDILNRVTLHGFDSLQILDHERCRPFAPDRQGINLGEGGALFLLEKNPSGVAFGAVEGYAAISEAHHMVQPAPSGVWMQKTMERALASRAWSAASIDYINAHGTGTVGNDEAEAQAVAAVFGDLGKLHATKGLSGHYLGAAGAVEAAITLALLQRRGLRRGLSNSFGFGGSNVSLLLSGVSS